MNNNYTNIGQAGAFGENAKSDNNSFVQTSPSADVNFAKLIEQLSKVRAEMKSQAAADEPEHDEAIGTIASAEKAAKAGDHSTALQYLRGLGGWTMEVVKGIGADLVKDAIEGKLGS